MRSPRRNATRTLTLLLSIMALGAASEVLADVTVTGDTGDPLTDEFLHIGNAADGTMEIHHGSDVT